MMHVVFGISAAGSLRQALSETGRDEAVAGFPDDLSFGPINPPSSPLRERWIDEFLGFDDYAEFRKRSDLFWEEVSKPDHSLVVWVSRRCAREYAGFLEFLWRIGKRKFEIVDITDVEFSTRPGKPRHPTSWTAMTFGEVTSRQMIDARLFDLRKEMPEADIERYRAEWRQLRSEDAPLRVIRDHRLSSAPLSYFDDVVMSCVTGEWQESARIVGETLAKLVANQFRHCGDLILWSRLQALVELDTFETKGDFSNMYQSFVRYRDLKP